MTRFNRIRRRPDHWSSPHARARARAAERIDGPLGLAEATWLDEHLAGCAACAAIAAQYHLDRTALRALRDTEPQPPRDLWARTAVAIERESAPAGGASRRVGGGRPFRLPIGVLSGAAAAVVVIAFGVAAVGLFGRGPDVAVADPGATSSSSPTAVPGSPAPASGSISPAPTPLVTDAGAVAWVRRASDGTLAFTNAPVDRVCPVDGKAGCAALDDAGVEQLDLTATPKTVIGSPVDDQAVFVTDDGQGGDRLVVVSLPQRDRGGPAPASPDPAETPLPSTDPSASPSNGPTDPIATPEPTPTPTLSPEPTVAADLALASDITLVGQSAAFNADGTWFAFTARPNDRSRGPDVYVWRVGDSAATRLTDDGASTFASWSGSTVVVSRPVDAAALESTAGSSVAIDPTTGDATAFEGPASRPALDPSGARAVAWLGTVSFDAEQGAWRPLDGRLALIAWPPVAPDAAASPEPGAAPQVLHDGPIGELDVRWDETGTWVAVWIGDPLGSDVGRLSLYHVDPASGLAVQPEGAPAGDPALAGFSIAQGRLAWVGPPGADGEGSNIQVAAWVGDDVGTVESVPGQGIIVVR